MKIKHLLVSLGLALGVALGLLWVLGSQDVEAGVALAAAPTPSSPSLRTCWARLNDDPTDYATVQAAVDAAGEGDTVKVAGYCTGVEGRPRQDVSTTGVVTQVVYVSKTVTIQGGYTTTNWTTPDPEANPTTLDAGGEGRVLYATGEVSSTIKGLHITGGDAAGLGGDRLWIGYEIDAGGGFYGISATLTMSNCHVFSNTADYGGGLYAFSGRVTLGSSWVFSNTAGVGGGVAIAWSDGTELLGNAIYGNEAGHVGGGILLWYSETVAEDNDVHDNEGGGIFLWAGRGASSALLSCNTVRDNTAQRGGGIHVWDSSQVALDRNVIRGNVAQEYGGGVWINFSAVDLVGNVIQDNVADAGGGIYMQVGGGSTLTNNVIVDNQASADGGGIYFAGTDASMEHNTVARNAGTVGVYVTTYSSYVSSVALTNTIVSSHTIGISVDSGNAVTVNGVLWHDTPIPIVGSGVTMQNEHIGDPAFAPDGYHITGVSAAVDVGVDAGVADDVDGQSRPWGAAPDLGADEVVIIYLPLVMRR